MTYVPIASVAEVNPPVAPEVASSPSRTVSFLPMASVGEDGKLHGPMERVAGAVLKGYTPFARGDILVAKITPCFENGKVAYLNSLPHEFGFGSTEFHVLRPRPAIDPVYLLNFLRGDAFRHVGALAMTGSAGQKRVPSDIFTRVRIPLPPLPLQHQAARRLDEVDTLRRASVKARGLLEALVQSAFHSLVAEGNPDYRHWHLRRLETLADGKDGSMRTGPFGSALRHSEFVSEGIAVLGIDNAVRNRFVWDERRFITAEKHVGLERYTVRPGDVMITIMGTTGRSAVVPDDIPPSITTKHIATITVDRRQVHPDYLSNAIHRDSGVLRKLRSRNRGSIMEGLNLGLIRELEIRVPPLALQERFAAVLEQVRKLESLNDVAQRAADALAHSIQHEVFACSPGAGDTEAATNGHDLSVSPRTARRRGE